MSRIEGKDDPSFGAMCMICDREEAVVMWMGHKNIEVCHACAMAALPSMLADLFVTKSAEWAHKGLKEVESRFWECAFCAIRNRHIK